MAQIENPTQQREKVVIDLDRVMINVPQSMVRFHAAAKYAGASTDQIGEIKKIQASTENDGGSFEPLTLIKNALDTEGLDRFNNYFDNADSHPVAYPEARPFEDELIKHDVSFFYLTYGVSAPWQLKKYMGSQLKGPIVVTDTQDKVSVLDHARTVDESGKVSYLFAASTMRQGSERFDNIVLLEDKGSALRKLHQEDRGYHVTEYSKKPDEQVPGNVKKIGTVADLTVDEDGKLVKKAEDSPVTVFSTNNIQ